MERTIHHETATLQRSLRLRPPTVEPSVIDPNFCTRPISLESKKIQESIKSENSFSPQTPDCTE